MSLRPFLYGKGPGVRSAFLYHGALAEPIFDVASNWRYRARAPRIEGNKGRTR
jgi:hypothetical protein